VKTPARNSTYLALPYSERPQGAFALLKIRMTLYNNYKASYHFTRGVAKDFG